MRARATEQQADAGMIEGHERVLLSALMSGTDSLPVSEDDFSSLQPPQAEITQ